MSIYLRIGQIVYKTSDKTIVGRGAPFTVLGDDKNIARAHFVVIQKNSKLYIKDLKSESGTFLHGEKVPTSESINIQNGDKITIGSQLIEVFTERPEGNMVTVSRAFFDSGSDIVGKLGKCFAGVVCVSFFLTWIIFSKSKDDSISGNALSFFVTAIIVSTTSVFLGAGIGIFLRRGYTPKDIYLGSDGFTVHFFDGTNMTFQNSNIEFWEERGDFLHLMMNGIGYQILKDKNMAPVLEHLKANVSMGHKRSLLKLYSLIAVVFIIGPIASSISMFKDYEEALMGLAFLCVAVSCHKKWRVDFWGRPASGSLSKKDKKMQWKIAMFLAVMMTFTGYMGYASWQNESREVANVESCLAGDQNACKIYNRWALPYDFVVPAVVIKKACALKNPSCPTQYKRLPAQAH